MRIALVQHQASADVDANLRRGLDAARAAADDGAELVVFAELAFTPFYPRQRATPERLERAEPVPGPTTEAFQELARERGVTVVLTCSSVPGTAPSMRLRSSTQMAASWESRACCTSPTTPASTSRATTRPAPVAWESMTPGSGRSACVARYTTSVAPALIRDSIRNPEISRSMRPSSRGGLGISYW